ncbi:MAG: hypothetical protein PUC29_02260 [Clostridia bacterium]|nr:hypothetical protein [Clostridia bacterium]
MIAFTKNKLLLLHKMALQTPGGDFSIKDNVCIDSMLDEAFNTDKYLTKEEKAAYLGFSIITKQPFALENTGAGIYIMLSFLEVNGVKMNPETEEVVEIGRGIADGRIDYEGVLNWIQEKEFR